MGELKANLAVYKEQMCMPAAFCDSWEEDSGHLNILMAILRAWSLRQRMKWLTQVPLSQSILHLRWHESKLWDSDLFKTARASHIQQFSLPEASDSFPGHQRQLLVNQLQDFFLVLSLPLLTRRNIQRWAAHTAVCCGPPNGIGRGYWCLWGTQHEVPSMLLAYYWKYWMIFVFRPKDTCQQCILLGQGERKLCVIPSYHNTLLCFLVSDLLLTLSQEQMESSYKDSKAPFKTFSSFLIFFGCIFLNRQCVILLQYAYSGSKYAFSKTPDYLFIRNIFFPKCLEHIKGHWSTQECTEVFVRTMRIFPDFYYFVLIRTAIFLSYQTNRVRHICFLSENMLLCTESRYNFLSCLHDETTQFLSSFSSDFIGDSETSVLNIEGFTATLSSFLWEYSVTSIYIGRIFSIS